MLSELFSVNLSLFFWYCYMLFMEESVALFCHELSSASFTFYSHL